MKPIQMTLDDELIREVDVIVKKQHTTRSAFTRKALHDAIANYYRLAMEQKHKKGYKRYPVQDNEFSDWESEQEWGD